MFVSRACATRNHSADCPFPEIFARIRLFRASSDKQVNFRARVRLSVIVMAIRSVKNRHENVYRKSD
jgi:hypothetical protein